MQAMNNVHLDKSSFEIQVFLYGSAVYVNYSWFCVIPAGQHRCIWPKMIFLNLCNLKFKNVNLARVSLSNNLKICLIPVTHFIHTWLKPVGHLG